ncbi:MAG: PEP-CTERM sorting domain-containing protein [Limisphaerales bacterium]
MILENQQRVFWMSHWKNFGNRSRIARYVRGSSLAQFPLSLLAVITSLVGLSPVLIAEERPGSSVLTAVSSTTLSGYVSTSASWSGTVDNSFILNGVLFSTSSPFGSSVTYVSDSFGPGGFIRNAHSHTVFIGAVGGYSSGENPPYPFLFAPGTQLPSAGVGVTPMDVLGPAVQLNSLPAAVPEPSSIALIVGGALSFFSAMRRRT